MYAAFRECGARRNACCDKPMWRSVDSPECECMQHFGSAKHGEMRVATNQCGEASIARNANVCSISRVRSTEKCVLRQEARRVATNQCGEAPIARNANVCSISRVRSTEKCVLRQETRRVATNQCGEASIARNANVCSISRVRSTEKCVLRQEARRVATISWK